MKKYFHTLLALFFIVVNDYYGMKIKKKTTVTQIFTVEEIPNYLSTEEKEALAGIIKLGIKIYNFQTSQENKIIRLNLSNNQIKKLDLLVNLLKDIPNLFFLDLNNCGIEDIAPLIKALPRLKKLYLNNNNIKKIPDLKNLTDLTLLDLSNNKVEIDSKDKDKLNKKIEFNYSVKQEIVGPEKKQVPTTKVEQNIHSEPKELEQNQIFKKKENNDIKTGLNTKNQFFVKIKNLDDKDSKKKTIASDSNNSKSNSKNSNPIPKSNNDEFKKENSKKTSPSYMDLFNKYKNWVVAGLTVAAIGGSAYLYNRLKKQKKVD